MKYANHPWSICPTLLCTWVLVGTPVAYGNTDEEFVGPFPSRFELRGDGREASVLALNNQFWVQRPGTTADTVWQNKAQPPAPGGLVGCNVNTSNREAAPKGFAFLANVGDHPDPARSKFGSGPLDDRGGVDDATILRHLEPLRTARVWLPAATAAGTTDVRLQRVMASGGREAVIEFRAGP